MAKCKRFGITMAKGVAVIFIFLSQQASAEPATNASIQITAKSLIAKLYPEKEITSISYGDLNGDGIPDLAYVIQDGMGAALVGVLRGQSDGAFGPWWNSKEMTTFTTVEVDNRRGALFVEKYYASRTTVSNYEAQFQYRRGELMLIELNEQHQSPIHDDEPGPKHSENIIANYLTGDMVSRIETDCKVTLSRQKEPVGSLVKFQDWGDDFSPNVVPAWIQPIGRSWLWIQLVDATHFYGALEVWNQPVDATHDVRYARARGI